MGQKYSLESDSDDNESENEEESGVITRSMQAQENVKDNIASRVKRRRAKQEK